MPGRLQGRPQNWQLLAGYMAFDVQRHPRPPDLGVASTVVVAFILFGGLLAATGGSEFFTDAALLGMGRFRGGAMKIAVLASGLFGSISGSAVANVVGTGVVTIPMIKRDGYPAHKAAAIEAVASTGGQLMPPVMGAAAFLMAEFLAVPYSDDRACRAGPGAALLRRALHPGRPRGGQAGHLAGCPRPTSRPGAACCAEAALRRSPSRC